MFTPYLRYITATKNYLWYVIYGQVCNFSRMSPSALR